MTINVLVACEFSGTVREAFKEMGFNAYSVDLEPSEIPSNQHYQEDAIKHINKHPGFYDLLIAHPPCTYLAVSGARWFNVPERLEKQREAVKFFLEFTKTDIPHYAIENPISIMATKYRKPDQYIQPYEYGHGETKKTSLWLYNLPSLKPTKIVNGRADRIHKMPPTKNPLIRQQERSRTYKGIAQAMAEQWGIYLEDVIQ